MIRASVRTRSAAMDARVTALESSYSDISVAIAALQHIEARLTRMEERSELVDRRLDSLETRREGSDQAFQTTSHQDDREGSQRRREDNRREGGSCHEPRIPIIRLDFPKFSDGDDPLEWVYKAEQYFDYFAISPEKKVKMVSFHLDREALQWYQWEECATTFPIWEDFIKAFCREFGSHGFEDYAESLFKLRQYGSLRDYISEFRRLATRIRDLGPSFRLSCFIGGLKEELKHDVKLLRPATVQEAISFAIEVDLKLSFTSFGNYKSELPLFPAKNEIIPQKNDIKPKEGLPIRKLTPDEIQYKRQNNLCFYCDEKFVRGHNCIKKQILLLDLGCDNKEKEIVQELQKSEQVEITACCITACALFGTPATAAIKTMKVKAMIRNCPVVVLFDSGSSHNFIDHILVRKLGWTLDQSMIFDIMIGDGGQVKSKGGCAMVPLRIGQYEYKSDMLALPLGHCEVVLGVQWLRTLGPVLWDFEKLTMKFWHQGVKICLSSSKPMSSITPYEQGTTRFDSIDRSLAARDQMLKLQLGEQVSPTLVLPHITDGGIILKEPLAILERKLVKRDTSSGVDVLLQWKHHFMGEPYGKTTMIYRQGSRRILLLSLKLFPIQIDITSKFNFVFVIMLIFVLYTCFDCLISSLQTVNLVSKGRVMIESQL